MGALKKNIKCVFYVCMRQYETRLYIRMRQGLFFALPDVIDAFVVPAKHTRGKDA